MYLAGKDAAFFFARGQKFIDALHEDKEYFMKILECVLPDDTTFEKIQSVEDLAKYDTEFGCLRAFLNAYCYNGFLKEQLFDYLDGGMYDCAIVPNQFFDEDDQEIIEETFEDIKRRLNEQDKRELMTDCLIDDFQETEYVQINMLPTNEDITKVAKWLCGGVKKSSNPSFYADELLKMLAFEQCKDFALSYEYKEHAPSYTYIALHNLEVELKMQFVKDKIAFDGYWQFNSNNKLYSVWDFPNEKQRLAKLNKNSIYSTLRVENKDVIYRKLLGTLKGYKGKKLAVAIHVLENEGYLSRKPSTAILQLEVGDTTKKQYFDKCYKDVSPAFSKDEINHWKEVFEKLFNGD